MRLFSIAATAVLSAALSGCGRDPAPADGAKPGVERTAQGAAPTGAPAGENSSESVLRDLKNPDEAARLRAAKIAGRMGAGASVAVADALAQAAAGDPDADVRRVAGEALEKVRGRAVAAPPAGDKADPEKGGGKERPQPKSDEKSKEPKAEHSLVGVWKGRIVFAGIPLLLTFTLTADGKYTLVSETAGPAGNAASGGTYTYEGGVLITNDPATGAVERAVVAWVSADELRYSAGGLQISYRRAR